MGCQKRRKINTRTLSQWVYVLSIYCQRVPVTLDIYGLENLSISVYISSIPRGVELFCMSISNADKTHLKSNII